MQRINIIDTIGRDRHVENIEGGEFSYKQVLSNVTQAHWKLDIRFFDAAKNVAILVETKQRQVDSDKEQLFDYVALEQRMNRNTKIIAILADTSLTNKIRVWKIWRNSVEELADETVLKSFDEYARLFERQTYNNAAAVLQNTNELNELLHTNGIKEGKRSQFVGTCMLALKNDLVYKDRTTSEILANIKSKLGEYLQNSVNKAEKIALLSTNVLQDQNVEALEAQHFEEILDFINEKILPYINDNSTKGQDILSFFFTTFSKYVNRGDKNQAFTPNHIAHFMCKVGGINKNLRVFDPTCGSGTFLVQAMTQILDECDTEAEKNNVKQNQIYGIEYDRDVYGLATTNMLIHSDGNSNIIQASCFDKANWIREKNIGMVLMNPPYNAQKTVVPRDYANTWGKSKEDPSKGLYFVRYVADTVGQGRLLTLLPMKCAIKTNTIIADIKTDMLRRHTLDAVFSFPAEMFYPGASAVACCMVFKLGQPHPRNYETFFGYFKDDGFEKRKGVGRTDVKGRWADIEKEWLFLYEHRLTEAGLSVMQRIDSGNQEWCAEAYMETDYSTLRDEDFINKMRDYSAFIVGSSSANQILSFTNQPLSALKLELKVEEWKWFRVGELFNVELSRGDLKPNECIVGEIPLISSGDTNNGVVMNIREGDGVAEIFDGNVLTVDMFCKSYYQPKCFYAVSHGRVNILKPKFPNFNQYIAMFLTTVIDNERFKFSYGRAVYSSVIDQLIIKLPAIKTANGEYEPDWQWMEDYIKGLPYSGCLELNQDNQEIQPAPEYSAARKGKSTTSQSPLTVLYTQPYDSFGPNYRIKLTYDFDTDNLQYQISGRRENVKLTADAIASIKNYLKKSNNINQFFNNAHYTPDLVMSGHVTHHSLTMKQGGREKTVTNGEEQPWDEFWSSLCWNQNSFIEK